MSENNTQENYKTIKDDQADNSPSKEIRTYVDSALNSVKITAWNNIQIS